MDEGSTWQEVTPRPYTGGEQKSELGPMLSENTGSLPAFFSRGCVVDVCKLLLHHSARSRALPKPFSSTCTNIRKLAKLWPMSGLVLCGQPSGRAS